ncbi:MAG: helix-turn-helix transcriptional regulator [Phycisphaerales bacterium]
MTSKQQLLETPRGQILRRLRRGPATVRDLVSMLSITANGVRAHLVALEAAGMVEQVGQVPGKRRPHRLYGLTEEGERRFHRGYRALADALLTAISAELPPGSAGRVFSAAAKAIADSAGDLPAEIDFATRLDTAERVVAELGAMVEVTRDDGEVRIQGYGCPIGDIVRTHPEACRVLADAIGEILGAPVRDVCDRDGQPACRFVCRARP